MSNIYNKIMTNYANSPFKCYCGTLYSTCSFMQKYNHPDASNPENIRINFLYYYVKIIPELQNDVRLPYS